MKLAKVFFAIAALMLIVTGPLAIPAGACVGKTLVIGSTGTVQQQVLAEMLSVLISERTGTTVKVVSYPDVQQAHKALLKADLDMLINYTGVGRVEILKQPPIADPDQLYREVKHAYNQELNLVWLKPLGFDEPRVAPPGTTAEAAPVVRKDTLKKFPALARLIDKLGGKIDAVAMHKLEQEAASEPARQVARSFLKANRLI